MSDSRTSVKAAVLRRRIRRGQLIWLWPVPVTVAIAVSGSAWGPPGALVVTAVVTGLLVFMAALRVNPNRRIVAACLVTAVVGAVVVVLAFQHPSRQSPAEGPGPVDLRGRTPSVEDLSRLDLRGGQLGGAGFAGRDLRGRDLSGADAPGATFQGANLWRASLRGADLRGANFSGACLREANLAGADLAGADVSRADLTDAVLPAGWQSTATGAPLGAGDTAASCAVGRP
jgi:hypothetical protein